MAVNYTDHLGSRVNKRGLIWFLIITFGFTWLIDLLLLVSGQRLSGPWSVPAIVLTMFGPTLGTFVVTHWITPDKHIKATTGLGLGAKGTRWGLYYLFAMIAMPLFVIGALFVGSLLGLYHMDLTNFSAYRQALDSAPGGSKVLEQVPIGTLVLVQLVSLPVLGLINIPATFGEEYGWRGYLLPTLLPLGQWRALILHGVIWGIWHAPIILMGYNYPTNPLLGAFMMVVFTVLVGIIFGWMRLATGSVWPSTIGHAEINASGGSALLLAAANTRIDTTSATILGWSGWLLMIAFIGLLVALRALPVRGAQTRNPIPGEMHPEAAPLEPSATPVTA